MEKSVVFLLFGLGFIALTGSISAAPGSWERYTETVNRLSPHFRKFTLSNDTSKVNFGAEFNCEQSTSPEPPTSVHQLRPGDIKVVAALGDSITAGNGAAAKYLPGVAIEARGLVATIGGDETLDTVVTLPNVLRKYNEELYGYSIGNGNEDSPEARLNVAVPGGKSHDMPEQAEELVSRLYEDPNVNVEEDWKIVSIFIGGNDICAWCNDKERYGPKQYVANIEEAIRILEKVPRTFVNVVSMLNVYEVGNITRGVVCEVFHWVACDCAIGKNEKIAELKVINKEYQRLLEESINSGQFDTRDDFTAVYQPFWHDTSLPTTPDGKVDASYFSPDCFHFSEKGHTAYAIALWNNMIQPVGEKDTKWTVGEELKCPMKDSPYLFTNGNSKVPRDESSDYYPWDSSDYSLWDSEPKEISDNVYYPYDDVIPPNNDIPNGGGNEYQWKTDDDTKGASLSVEMIVIASLSVIALTLILIGIILEIVYVTKRRQLQTRACDKEALKKCEHEH